MTSARTNPGGHAVFVGIFAILAATLLSACGGGGGGGGGGAPPGGQIPPPGGGPRPVASAVSSGLFLGQGSVIVNGVQFSRDPGVAADNSVFIDDAAAPAGDAALRVGMVVKVRGSFGPTTLTGTYQSVEAEPQVIGTVEGLSGNTFTVLGQSVAVTTFTLFDNPLNRTLNNGDIVEVHGFFTGTNAIESTFIQRDPAGTTKRQVRGTVSGLGASTFLVNGTQQVTFTPPAPAGLSDGDFVEVEGTGGGAGVALQAATVTVEDLAAEAADREIEIEGSVAAGSVAATTFTLLTASGPATVSFGAATVFQDEDNLTIPSGTVLGAGNHVEVEGIMGANGVLAATEIELERKENVVLEGNVSGGTLFGLSLSPPLAFADGTHLEVGGEAAPGATSIAVTRVTVLAASPNVVIRGPVTGVVSTLDNTTISNAFSILGIAIDLTGLQERDDPVLGLTSEFENAANIRIQGATDWIVLLRNNITVVKAKAQEDVLSPPFDPVTNTFHPRSGVEIEEHR